MKLCKNSDKIIIEITSPNNYLNIILYFNLKILMIFKTYNQTIFNKKYKLSTSNTHHYIIINLSFRKRKRKKDSQTDENMFFMF